MPPRWMSLVLGAALFYCGCGPGSAGAPGAPADGPALTDAERRLALREELVRSLGERYDEPLPAVDALGRAQGAEVWARLCSSCHGRTGRGSTTLARALPVAPGDLADPERAAFFSPRAKMWIVSEGSAGTPMTGWKEVLDEAALFAVLAHLETLVRREEGG